MDYREALEDRGGALPGRPGIRASAALALGGEYHKALYNLGNALAARARLVSGAEADALYRQAGEKYAAALALKPDKHEALNNWGNALLSQARTRAGAAADALFARACEKYAAALRIKPDKHESLNNWGAALAERAALKAGPAADALFEGAGEKFAAALALRRDYLEALENWGATLLRHYHRTRDRGLKPALLGRARRVFLQIEKLAPGRAAYTLACLCSLGGRRAACRYWLERCRSAGTPLNPVLLAADPDLAPVRGCAWFRELLAEAARPG